MYKADREVRPIFFNKTHYLHCTENMPLEPIIEKTHTIY